MGYHNIGNKGDLDKIKLKDNSRDNTIRNRITKAEYNNQTIIKCRKKNESSTYRIVECRNDILP